jgi:tetratricopeptide (TPR) repeat protein
MFGTVRDARLARITLVYLGASFAALEAVDLLSDRIGLPDWVFAGAVVLLIVGLPIVIATALVQSGPGRAPAPSVAAAEAAVSELGPAAAVAGKAGGSRHWLTWRKVILGGVLAFALLGIATTVYMVMRVTGIGPVGSLVAAGLLDDRERIILADFQNRSGDSLLAIAATEAFRIDFAQSPTITVAEREYVAGILARMEVERGAALDVDLAREVAVREGLGAVIAGEITAVGDSYVLSVEIVSAEGGRVLAGYRETAKGSGDVVAAIDRLSKKLRERIGESFRTIRRSPPLEQVTTGSLEALKKYTQAERAIYTEGDDTRGIELLEEALALDTAFAAAYAELAVVYNNRREQRARAVELLTKAYEHRDRLTDRERYNVIGTYHIAVTNDREKAISAFRTLLESYPDDDDALHQLAFLYGLLRNFARSEELYSRSIELDSSFAITFANLIGVQVAQGKWDQATVTLDRMAARVPEHPAVELISSAMASSRGEYETAEAHIRSLREARNESLLWRSNTSGQLARLATVRGKLAEAERHLRDALAADELRGLPAKYLEDAIQLAWLEVWFRGVLDAGLARIEAVLGRYPLESFDPLDRPYVELARLYAFGGMPERARALLEGWQASVDTRARRGVAPELHSVRGVIALAEERPQEAISEFRIWDEGTACTVCALPSLGLAYDVAGQPDSAIAVYERYLETPWLLRIGTDSYQRARAYERLAALYDGRGDAEKAIYYYGKLVDLWQDADPGLQPRVEAARRAIRALAPDR